MYLPPAPTASVTWGVAHQERLIWFKSLTTQDEGLVWGSIFSICKQVLK
jgi:hypothetical protein